MERLSCKKHYPHDPRRAASRRWGIVCFLLATTATLFAASFTATLDRDTIVLGESVNLTFTFEGVSPGGMPKLPPMPGLKIGDSVSSSLNSSLGPDGQMHSVQSYSVPLIAGRVGEFQIPAFQIEIGGQKLTSEPLKLKVVASDQAAGSAQIVFLKLALPKTNIYLGEALVGELQLHLQDGIQGLSQFQLTATPAEGFAVGKMAESPRRRAQVGTKGYVVIPVKILLKPVKTGPLSIGPLTASVVVELPGSPRRRESIFDLFTVTDRKQFTLTTETASVQCLPLPADNRPADFTGAVGNYTMDVNIGPTNVAAGDPITVRVQIAGQGSLDAITLPEQSAWRNFKTYPPTANTEVSDALGLVGRKTFEQVITPENTDIKELPAFSFSFFDPEAGRYRTLKRPAVPLTIRPGGTTPVPVIAATRLATSDNPPPQQDIAPLKQHLGRLSPAALPLIRQPWFIGLQSAPLLIWLCALGWRKRADALANNPRLRRQRQVAQIVRTGLSQLRQLANGNKSEEFFAVLVHLLQEQLGERLDCPASAITEAVIEDRLRPRGLPEAALSALHELFQICNLARYAPVKSSQELAALIPKMEATLRELQNLRA